MKVILYTVTFLTFILNTAIGAKTADEDPKKLFDEAENHFNNEDYALALPLYLKLDSLDAGNANLKFKIGVCYLNSPLEKVKAVSFLQAAVNDAYSRYVEGSFKERGAPLVAYNYLAQAYHYNYQFDDALLMYEKFLGFLGNTDPPMADQIRQQMLMCNNGKELIAAPVNIKVENIGPNINSVYADYSPVIVADESMIFFTSRREGSTGNKVDEDGKFFEDIYVSEKKDSIWQPAVNIGTSINTDGNDATIGISIDGQKLIIYKDDQGDGNIYTSDLIGTQWSSPVKMNENINTKAWEPSASISADGTVLYFSSNRPGGLGGRDIYKSRKLPNGQWGKAINLGSQINTPYDDDAPYIHPDGITLFFSSIGHKSMGGFDIFFSVLSDDGAWSTPANMGFPVNTTGDDIFYIPTPDNKRAYYSSFKSGGYGEKDVYMLTFPDQKETPLTVYKGLIVKEGGIPEDVEITITDNETGEVVGVYTPNTVTGKYLFILQPGRNYHIAYEADGFLFRSENMEVPEATSTYSTVDKEIEMSEIKPGEKTILRNLFFDFNQATLKQESKVELEKIRDLMRLNPGLIVEISGHTDSKGNDDFNMKLSQQRAQAVVNYLINEGIDKKRLIAKGYGETQPIASNTNPDGSDNPDGMAQNRRTEFKVLQIK